MSLISYFIHVVQETRVGKKKKEYPKHFSINFAYIFFMYLFIFVVALVSFISLSLWWFFCSFAFRF